MDRLGLVPSDTDRETGRGPNSAMSTLRGPSGSAPACDSPEHPGSTAAEDLPNATVASLFGSLCRVLDAHGIRYVILAGHEDYPRHIGSDVDFMVDAHDFARLPGLLSDSALWGGARLVQVLRHEVTAAYYVLALQLGARVWYLHPDAASDYLIHAQVWLRPDPLLEGRRRSPQGFWIPAASREFEYYFIKRTAWKASVGPDHVRRLARSLSEDPAGCRAVLAARVGPAWLDAAEQAIRTLDSAWFAQHMPALQSAVRASRPREPLTERLRRRVGDVARVWDRIVRPTGLVVAVLGPDGSGKSTVLRVLADQLRPAFRRVDRFHLRPRLTAGATSNDAVEVTRPHAQAPRGTLASLLKCAYFLLDLWGGWITRIGPARVQSGLVLFDRYVTDLLIDPRRYRMRGGFAPARWLCRLAPQPDLWLVLVAKPDTIVARKGELTTEKAIELVDAYRRFGAQQASAVCISTEGSLDDTCEQVLRAVLDHLARRTAARLEQA